MTRKINVPKTIDSQKRKYGEFMKEHGQDQLLNPKSAKQQAKENFNKWFKGSQIVDEAGEPLVVYHGTLDDFDEFSKDRIGTRHSQDDIGFYFTNKKNVADDYASSEFDYTKKGKVIPTYINGKKPLKIDNKWAKDNGLGSVFDREDSISFWDNYQEFVKDEMQKIGADSIIIDDGYQQMVVALEPNQIKSVKNSGGWSKSPSLTDPDWVAEPSVDDLFDGLNGFQKKSLASAIKQGSERTNSKLGSLESLNEAKKKLNDMITQAYKDGNKSDVLHLEGIKNRLDNTLGKGLKGRDRPYAKALQMEEAYNKGWEYNPNNVKLKEYTDNLNPLERNAFAQGLFGRMTYNPLMSKNLAKKAMDYDNTLQTVLPKKTYGELQKGLSKQNTRFERLSRLGKRAETRLQTPEGSRVFLREQLEETTPQKIGLPALGAMLDEALYRGHKKALNKAAINLLDPTFEGVNDAWLIENYPTLNAYISGALANELANE